MSVRKIINSNDLEHIVTNNLYGINKHYGIFLRLKDLNLKTLIKLNDNYMTIKGKPINTITIYFIKVDSPFRGKGNFSELLKEINKIAKKTKRSILIQEVINPNLEKILKKKGYKKVDKGSKYYDYIKLM